MFTVSIRNLVALCFAALSTVLASCGGGGSSTTASDSPFDLRAAYENYFKATGTHTFVLSGSVSGLPVQGSGALTEAALQPATFDSKPALLKVSSMDGTLIVQGTSFPMAAVTYTYLNLDYTPLGSVNGEYVVVRQPVSAPQLARVGDAGTWYIADVYTDGTKAMALGTLVATYTVDADTASSAILTVTFASRDLGQATFSTAVARFRVLPEGGITRLSESVTDAASNLTITYD